METSTAPRELADDPDYLRARQAALKALDLGLIDRALVDLIKGFASLPQCYTLQCCNGVE